jgi:carbon storage regulator
MLVLARREGEEIVIPEFDVVVRVLKVRGKSVSVGIDAPSEVRIARGELVGSQRPRRRTRKRELVKIAG